MHELQNEFLSINVNSIGAEISSLKNLETWIEHLWQGNPEFWASQAPNLFPVIGVLKNGEYIFDGKTYKMPKHGFIRYNEEIKFKEKTSNSLAFQLEYSEKTLEIYPSGRFCRNIPGFRNVFFFARGKQGQRGVLTIRVGENLGGQL